MSRSQCSAFLQATRLRTPADTVEADATWSPMGPTPQLYSYSIKNSPILLGYTRVTATIFTWRVLQASACWCSWVVSSTGVFLADLSWMVHIRTKNHLCKHILKSFTSPSWKRHTLQTQHFKHIGDNSRIQENQIHWRTSHDIIWCIIIYIYRYRYYIYIWT